MCPRMLMQACVPCSVVGQVYLSIGLASLVVHGPQGLWCLSRLCPCVLCLLCECLFVCCCPSDEAEDQRQDKGIHLQLLCGCFAKCVLNVSPSAVYRVYSYQLARRSLIHSIQATSRRPPAKDPAAGRKRYLVDFAVRRGRARGRSCFEGPGPCGTEVCHSAAPGLGAAEGGFSTSPEYRSSGLRRRV